MRARRAFQTIDTHTVGEPTRTVVGGIPVIPGKTMVEKMTHLKENCDWIRKVLTHEPRGNDVMAGVILTTPCEPEADIGVIHFEGGCYQPMCGHNTIGVSTTLIEAGLVEVKEPYTHIVLDTPAGIVRVKVKVEDGVAKEVSLVNIPSFVLERDFTVDVPGFGNLTMDISYGGNMYALMASKQIGLDVSPQNARKLIDAYRIIIEAINAKKIFAHPEKPFITGVHHIEFFSEPTVPGAQAKNAVVFPPGAIDRSPCGTGSAAKLALLYAKGLLKKDEEFRHESIIGSIFKCKVIEETKVASLPAVVTEITGSAYITGMHTFLIDPEDPFPEGFELC